MFQDIALPRASIGAVLPIFCANNPALMDASCCFSRTFKKSVKTYCGLKIRPLELVEIHARTTIYSGWRAGAFMLPGVIKPKKIKE
ncbi:MAG: hypothetical protein KF834_13425 [Burkholderiales bacterium]|nr:hypothetical protein [Burkholderiales bacterium]